MKKSDKITHEVVESVKKLSNLELNKTEIKYLTKQFNQTLFVVDELNEIKTQEVKPTNHVTGLFNVFREDILDKKRILSQEEAISSSCETHNGYFVVKAIFDEK